MPTLDELIAGKTKTRGTPPGAVTLDDLLKKKQSWGGADRPPERGPATLYKGPTPQQETAWQTAATPAPVPEAAKWDAQIPVQETDYSFWNQPAVVPQTRPQVPQIAGESAVGLPEQPKDTRRTLGNEIADFNILDAMAMLPFSPTQGWEKKGYATAKERLAQGEYGQRYGMTPMGGYTTTQAPATSEQLRDVVKEYEQKQAQGQTVPAAIFQGATALPAYMGEFALGGEGAKALGLAGKGLKGALAASGVRTLLQPQRISDAIIDQQGKGEKPATALLKAYGDVYIENLSELGGSAPAAVLRKLPFGGKVLKAMADLAKKTGIPENELIQKISTKAGWNGLVGEWGEERLGTLLRAITDVDDFGAGKDAPVYERVAAGLAQDMQAQNQLVELGVLSIPGVTKFAAGKVLERPAQPKTLDQIITEKTQDVPTAAQEEVKPGISEIMRGMPVVAPRAGLQEVQRGTEQGIGPIRGTTLAKAGEAQTMVAKVPGLDQYAPGELRQEVQRGREEIQAAPGKGEIAAPAPGLAVGPQAVEAAPQVERAVPEAEAGEGQAPLVEKAGEVGKEPWEMTFEQFVDTAIEGPEVYDAISRNESPTASRLVYELNRRNVPTSETHQGHNEISVTLEIPFDQIPGELKSVAGIKFRPLDYGDRIVTSMKVPVANIDEVVRALPPHISNPNLTVNREASEEIRADQSATYDQWVERGDALAKSGPEGQVIVQGGAAVTPTSSSQTSPALPETVTPVLMSETWKTGGTRPFAFDENSTKNEGRFRLQDPALFDKDSYFRRKSSTAGVSYIMGRKAGGEPEIQAVRFDKSKFTEEQAAQWMTKNADRLGRSAMFVPDPTVPVAGKGEGGFAGVVGRPGGVTEKPWLDEKKTQSPDSQVEDFFARTKFSMPRTWKVGRLLDRIRLGLRERFIFAHHLPITTEAALARDMIRTLPEEVRNAGAKAIDDMEKIVTGDKTVQALDSAGLDLLRRKVFVQDLLREAELDRSVSGDLTLDQLKKENARLDDLLAKVPSAQKAYEARQALWKAVGEDLYNRGVIGEENRDNAAYVRHFVLTHSQLVSRGVSLRRKKLAEPYRSYKKQRKGYTGDISTNYLAVEITALSDIYRDNAIEDLANNIAKTYDKRDVYVKKAKGTDKTAEQLAESDGYREWFYKRPNLIYRANTIAESQMAALIENGAEEAGGILNIPKDKIREALVLGGRRKGWLIPDWLADQLDDLPVNKRSNYVVASFTRPFVQFLKRWYLRINPFRYNARNQIGDTERLNAAGQTSAVLKIPEAVKLLVTKEGQIYEHARRFGVIGSSLWNEMNDPAMLKQFERVRNLGEQKTFKRAVASAFRAPIRLVSTVGNLEQTLTQFREDILRMSVFLNTVEKLEKGESVRHWAGRVADVKEIAKTDKYRAAGKLSRETLTDYGEFTPFENDVLRNGLVPFYSFLKKNATFWPRALKNAAMEGKSKTVVGAAARMAAVNIPMWLVRVLGVYAAAWLWNHRDDEATKKEKSLPFWLRANLHVNIGKITLWGTTALSDFSEWFGMESLAGVNWRREAGFLTNREAAVEAARVIAQAPVNKIYQALQPVLKETQLAITGVETYPNVFRPRIVAPAASEKSLERAIVGLMGSDAKRFYETATGKRAFSDTLSAYYAGWWGKPTDETTLIEQIKKTATYSTLLSKSKRTGGKPGEAKSGRTQEWQEMNVQLKGLSPSATAGDRKNWLLKQAQEASIQKRMEGMKDASADDLLSEIAKLSYRESGLDSTTRKFHQRGSPHVGQERYVESLKKAWEAKTGKKMVKSHVFAAQNRQRIQERRDKIKKQREARTK